MDIVRIYTKDLSLEVPSAPEIFRETAQPEINLDLDIKNKDLEENHYEVELIVTVTAKMNDKNVFLIEVKQAGIFHVAGFTDEQKDHILHAYCPTVLFPYTREAVNSLVTRASLPPLTLAPINFDLLYAQNKGLIPQGEGEGSQTKH